MDNDTKMLSLFAVFVADSTFLVLFLLQKHVFSLNQTNLNVFIFQLLKYLVARRELFKSAFFHFIPVTTHTTVVPMTLVMEAKNIVPLMTKVFLLMFAMKIVLEVL